MAFSKVPTDCIASYDYADSKMSLPIAALPEITAGEADKTSGDIRQIILGLVEKFYQWYVALGTSQPTKLSISRTSITNDLTGEIIRTYIVQFKCDVAAGSTNVESET